jgi:hypothetical protein
MMSKLSVILDSKAMSSTAVASIFFHHCSCDRGMGAMQYDYETMFAERIGQFMSTARSEAEAIRQCRMAIAQEMRLQMCCRNILLNPPNPPIRSSLDTSTKIRGVSSPAFDFDNLGSLD